MSRRLALAALAALMLLPAGCGGEDEAPAGAPRERFGPEAVAGVLAVEEIRARLVPVTDFVALGRHADAARHLKAAQRDWDGLESEIRAADPILAREVSVAFGRVARALARRATFDGVRDVAAPLSAQLMGGVREQLVEKQARLDSGVNAAVVVALLDRLTAEYADGGEEALAHAFGLVDRSQAVAREVAGDLGPRRDAVIEGLKDLRKAGWPDGLQGPAGAIPAAEAGERAAAIQTALRERFALAP